MSTATLAGATDVLSQPATLSIHTLRPPPSALLPTDLLADLEHHRSLFSKLRFSYTEQVTKERLLKAVSSDPPALVGGAAELAALETKLADDKGALKGKKTDVETLLRALGPRSRDVAAAWQGQEARTEATRDVGRDLARLERRRAELLAMRPQANEEPLMGLGLEETRETSAERMEEAEALAARVEEVRREVERRRVEVERMRMDVETVEAKKRAVVGEAMEMRRRRGSGEASMDEVEAQGRWAKAAEGMLKAVC